MMGQTERLLSGRKQSMLEAEKRGKRLLGRETGFVENRRFEVMPFITQTALTAHRPTAGSRNIFIGRLNERRFFREHILKPGTPGENVIWIWGKLGVGKSTLLARLREETRTFATRQAILTVLVDGWSMTPVAMMESVAAQLRMAGTPLTAFEQALAHSQQLIRRRQPEREVARTVFLHEVSGLTAGKIMGEPVIGGMYETVARQASESFWKEHPSLFIQQGEAQSDVIDHLTRAFVEDLNWITTTAILLRSRQGAAGTRLILFFDLGESSTEEAIRWLCASLLSSAISQQIVLVVAAHELPAPSLLAGQPVYSMPLASFSRDETRRYLALRGISDPHRLSAIWRLSAGLPFAVSLLALDAEQTFGEAEDMEIALLRWLSRQEYSKQQLVLQAALCSRPFCLDDLTALHAPSDREQIRLYRWLLELPFVQHNVQDGRHRCHALARRLLSHIFLQHRPQEYYLARRALGHQYQRQLKLSPVTAGKESYASEWLEAALALIPQLFSLPERDSHIRAVELSLMIAHQAKQEEKLLSLLRELSQEQSTLALNASASSMVELLLHYLEADMSGQEEASFITELLAIVGRASAFPALLLAHLYSKRGTAYLSRHEYQRAIKDFDQALLLDSTSVGTYLLRGITYAACHEYDRAIEDFDQALARDGREAFAYIHRGLTFRKCKNYQQAIDDFDHALLLDSQLDGVRFLRSLTYGELNAARRGREDFDRAAELNPHHPESYVLQGMAECYLDQEQVALENFTQTLELAPNEALAYAGRGHVYLEMGEIEQARANLLQSQQLDPNDSYVGLLLIWLELCQQEAFPDRPDLSERLEALAIPDQQSPVALLCRGVAQILRGRFEEALALLNQVDLLSVQAANAFFWKSLVYAFLERDEEAQQALRQALGAEVPLPAPLLAPLQWVEQKRPDFYQKYIEQEMLHSLKVGISEKTN